jgi:MFS family permease
MRRYPLRTATSRAAGGLREFPGQFWLLAGGSFVFLLGSALVDPFVTIYLNVRLGMSVTAIGIVFGASALVGLPFQIAAGSLADRRGRLAVLTVAVCAATTLYVGLAFARQWWQVAIVVAIESIFGWPMFVTSQNAIVADLIGVGRRTEGFGILRAGAAGAYCLGPILGGFALAHGVPYRLLFVIAAGGCAAFLVVVLLWLHETRPTIPPRTAGDESRGGYRVITRDRSFVLLCAAILLPLYCFDQIWSTLPIYANAVLGVPLGSWGLLYALYSLIVAVLQYPVVRGLRHQDEYLLLAAASALLGIGLGGMSLVSWGWPVVGLMVAASLGVVLLIPVSAALVAAMAPVALRGRYMGAWTLAWTLGEALGPAIGGWAMDTMGARSAYAAQLAIGGMGAAAFLALHRRSRRSPATRVSV